MQRTCCAEKNSCHQLVSTLQHLKRHVLHRERPQGVVVQRKFHRKVRQLTVPVYKKVFVTGGNGFIGSRVVRALCEQGITARCLLRETSNVDRIADLPFERVTGDVRDAGAVLSGFTGCDGAIHLASLSNWNDIDSPLMDQVVKGGTQNVLAAAQALGNPKVVFVSSVAAINGSEEPAVFNENSPYTLTDSKLTYAQHKRDAEAMCLASGVPVVIVNPAEVYGPDDHGLITAGNLIDFAKSSPVLVCDGGTCVVHVDDVAMGIVRALQRGRVGQRYILGGDNLSVRELAEVTLKLVGKKARIVKLPKSVIRGMASFGRTTKMPLPFNPRVIPYATRYWYADNTKARTELDVTFRSAADTLRPTVAWLRTAGHIA